MTDFELFTVGSGFDADEGHEIGNPECPECWNPPTQCNCGGLIHSAFGDENYDGDYWLIHSCEKCRDNYDEVE